MSNANEPDQVNSAVLAVILALVTLSVLGIALFVTSIVRDEAHHAESERGQNQDRATRELKTAQLSDLSKGPEYSDRGKGLIQIPIDRAMALTLSAVRDNPYALSPGVKPHDDGMGGAGPGAEADPASKTELSEDEKKASEKKAAEKKAGEKPAEKKIAPPTSPAPAPAPPAPAVPSPAVPTTP